MVPRKSWSQQDIVAEAIGERLSHHGKQANLHFPPARLSMPAPNAFPAVKGSNAPFGTRYDGSTVHLPEAAFVELETLAGKSGKRGFKRPGFSETVRAVIRLVSSREWSSEEIRQAFAEDVRAGE